MRPVPHAPPCPPHDNDTNPHPHAHAAAQGVREASKLLTRAFHQDPENPYVLVLLAHFSLRQGFHDNVRSDAMRMRAWGVVVARRGALGAASAPHHRGHPLRPSPAPAAQARKLASLAIEHANAPGLRSESQALLGRALHALGQLSDAGVWYQQVGAAPTWAGGVGGRWVLHPPGQEQRWRVSGATAGAWCGARLVLPPTHPTHPPNQPTNPAPRRTTPRPPPPQALITDPQLPLPRYGAALVSIAQVG